MKKNNIYLATKLFSFYDRYASTNMYEAVLRSKKYSSSLIYLPFRDSNMKVSTEGNVARNIFEADINSLNNTEIFICRIDGLSYDAGIGFELGYCLAKDCTLYVFSTDFYKTKIFNSKILISNMVNNICNAFKYEYKNNQTFSYEENLKYNIESFTEFVTNKIDNNNYKYANEFSNNEHYDIFIDFCGLKYEWNKILTEKLITYLDKNNISYCISNRYDKDYDCDKELCALSNSKIYINCFDENEPDFDSCILHGYAYKKGKYIIGYESNNVIYYVDGMQEMGVNLMIEQSCNTLVKNIEQLLNTIMELKNGKKSNLDILMIMFGFTFFSGSMLIGQTLSNGLNLIDFILCIFIGGIILGIFGGTLGFISSKTNDDMKNLSIKSFGVKGSYLPSFLVGITQVGWYGVGVSMFAVPVANIIFPSNTFILYLLIALFGIFMTISTSIGIKSITKVS